MPVEPGHTKTLDFSEDHETPGPAFKRRKFRYVSELNSEQKQLSQPREEVVASLDQKIQGPYHVMRIWGLVETSMLKLVESQGIPVNSDSNGAGYL